MTHHLNAAIICMGMARLGHVMVNGRAIPLRSREDVYNVLAALAQVLPNDQTQVSNVLSAILLGQLVGVLEQSDFEMLMHVSENVLTRDVLREFTETFDMRDIGNVVLATTSLMRILVA